MPKSSSLYWPSEDATVLTIISPGPCMLKLPPPTLGNNFCCLTCRPAARSCRNHCCYQKRLSHGSCFLCHWLQIQSPGQLLLIGGAQVTWPHSSCKRSRESKCLALPVLLQK